MIRMKTLTLFTLAALGLASVLGLMIYRTADAASPAAILTHVGGFGRGGISYNDDELAEALGITVEELTAAYQTAKENVINQALEEGLITQSQADSLLERGYAFPFHKRGGWLRENGIDYDAFLAQALGISLVRLQEAYQQAYQARIDQAVADGRLTEEEANFIRGRDALFSNESFRSSMRSAFESAVLQAVEDGVITQSQADEILSRQSGEGFLNFRGGLRGFGRHGGLGRAIPEGTIFSLPSLGDSNG
jgi:polyhydroxyalkanoate synthesis regulator phasin